MRHQLLSKSYAANKAITESKGEPRKSCTRQSEKFHPSSAKIARLISFYVILDILLKDEYTNLGGTCLVNTCISTNSCFLLFVLISILPLQMVSDSKKYTIWKMKTDREIGMRIDEWINLSIQWKQCFKKSSTLYQLWRGLIWLNDPLHCIYTTVSIYEGAPAMIQVPGHAEVQILSYLPQSAIPTWS